MQRFQLYIFILAFLGTNVLSAQLNQEGIVRVPVDSIGQINRIAFGSCNHQGLPQEMWLNVLESRPDLWIWLGDNIYGNSRNTKQLIRKYNKQLRRPNYRALLERIPVIGIWDDHDFGTDNCDSRYRLKKESELLFYEFIGEPLNSERRQHEGIYTSYVFGKPGHQVKIFLLDTRYFRGLACTKKSRNDTTDMLGEAQWAWLEDELFSSNAQINIIATGTQFLSDKPHQESWNDFPGSVKRMYDLIKRSEKPGVVFISGDIHCGELMKNNDPSLNYPLHEFTSSGLTHAHWQSGIKKNSYKVQNPYCGINYGLITINWKDPVSVKVELKDIQNFTAQEITFYLDDVKLKKASAD